ncbi:hypothetical protein HRbin10_02329 [bacterium HR10]|nr:hypothetical protein HRbin10_02329 [bacterium HR10]
MPAHQPFQRLRIERLSEQIQVLLIFTLTTQIIEESANGHIGDRQQPCEHDAESVPQLAPIIFFQLGLIGRQERPHRIVNEVERPFGIMPVTQRVQSLDRFDAFLIDAIPSLAAHIVLQIAGERSHQMHLMIAEKLRHGLHLRQKQHGQVRAHLHGLSLLSQGPDEAAQVRVQFGRSPGDVHPSRPHAPGQLNDPFHRRPLHHLRAPGRGLYVTMHAGLIAFQADIDLNCFNVKAVESRAGDLFDLLFKLIHCHCLHLSFYLTSQKSTPPIAAARGNVVTHAARIRATVFH